MQGRQLGPAAHVRDGPRSPGNATAPCDDAANSSRAAHVDPHQQTSAGGEPLGWLRGKEGDRQDGPCRAEGAALYSLTESTVGRIWFFCWPLRHFFIKKSAKTRMSSTATPPPMAT